MYLYINLTFFDIDIFFFKHGDDDIKNDDENDLDIIPLTLKVRSNRKNIIDHMYDTSLY